MGRGLKFIAANLFAAVLAQSSPTFAQDSYPNRNITMAVGFAAGGTSDIIARLLGQKLTEYTGANIIIENIPGAASMTAAKRFDIKPID